MNATNRNSNQRRRPRRRNRTGRKSNLSNTHNMQLSFTSSSIMPNRKVSVLRYLDGSTVRNSPGLNYLVYSMRINDLYDPDPAILSGSVSNFKELMQFYSSYRVLRVSIIWNVANLETFPISCGIVFSQTNMTGTIPSLADALNAFENDYTVPLRTLTGNSGRPNTSFKTDVLDLATMLGDRSQYKSESNYAGQGLATPTSPLWANFICVSPTGAALGNGYANSTTLFMESEFFGRLNVRA